MSIWSKCALLGLALAISLPATTLEQLSLDDMIQKSTGVVRAKVTGSFSSARGANTYTFYKLEIEETWKGASVKTMDVAVPGGVYRGVRQMVAGAPMLNVGQEYVLFLWTSRSGLTQVIGMSQGLFNVKMDSAGKQMATRAASGESMVDRLGRRVDDAPLTMPVSDMYRRVRSARSAGAASQGARE